MNSGKINTIIFDFDGTLAKLNIDFDLMRLEIDQLISAFGINPRKLQNHYILEKIKEVETILQKQSPHTEQSFLNQAFEIIEAIEIEAAANGELFELTKPLLSDLRELRFRTGIITRNCIRAVQTVFPDIFIYCPVVVCRDDVNRVKPHPEHITTALQKLGSHPQNALMIGDHPMDIKAGKNANTFTAGVLSGNFGSDDFAKEGADIILPRAADILTTLKLDHDVPISC